LVFWKVNVVDEKIEIDADWGTYAPPASSSLLRALVTAGISRGVVSKWIQTQWRKYYAALVDAEVRGIKYRLNISDNTTDAKLLLSSKFYDRTEIEALSVPNGRVFIDVGTNTGYYSLTLAMRGFDTIISIEPNPPTVRRLKFNIKVNDLDNLIKVIPVCVGEGGEVPFYTEGDLGSASLIQDQQDTEPILVESKPLYDILKEESITRIDSMKVDVEGFEDQALLPFFAVASRELWPKVMVLEHCHCHVWKTDLLNFLLDGRYRTTDKTRANTILKIIEG
jgi:FkbM family methyltransferase